jgi:hypothetical protein
MHFNDRTPSTSRRGQCKAPIVEITAVGRLTQPYIIGYQAGTDQSGDGDLGR